MTVDSIFAAAKAEFHYLSDQVCFGKAEYWAALPELQKVEQETGEIRGDCDDFASWCVGKLRAAGYTARYAICRVETGEWHCVAETTGLILDNRQDEVMPQWRLPYQWFSLSGAKPGDAWHEIKNGEDTNG